MSKVRHIHFEKLKRLEGLEISFPETGVVAIMGANGIGKSTILHALACLYQPDNKIKKEQKTYKWSRYFIPHGKNLWMGSSARVTFYDDGTCIKYSKDSDRWTPKYSLRKRRYVKLIGIGDYHPHLEQEKYHARFNYQIYEIDDKKHQKLIDHASYILNKKYKKFATATRHRCTVKGLWHVETDGGSYTSYYMGGGEQKVFYILDALLEAPKGGLVLIEEIEVLLHDHALRRLLQVINEIAQEKELQVIFSTHWTGIASFQDTIEIRTLLASKEGIQCIQGFDANSVYAITGNPADKCEVEIWVEDTLSETVVRRVAAELSISKNIRVKIFGSATNAFAVAATFVLSETTKGMIIILDGDVYKTADDKYDQIKRTLSGSGIEALQKSALSLICQYTPPSPKMKPEAFLLQTLRDGVFNSYRSIVDQFKDFVDTNVSKDKDKLVIVDLAIEFGISPAGVESALVDQFAEYLHLVADSVEDGGPLPVLVSLPVRNRKD